MRYLIRVLLAFEMLLLISCAAHVKPRPVMSATQQGAPVETVNPQRTMDRNNVPADVDPDDVIAHFTDPETGAEAWVSKTGPFGLGKPRIDRTPASHGSVTAHASNKSLDVDIAKYPWYHWPLIWLEWIALIVGIVALSYLRGLLSPVISLFKRVFNLRTSA